MQQHPSSESKIKVTRQPLHSSHAASGGKEGLKVVALMASHLDHTGRIKDLLQKTLKSIGAQTSPPDLALLSVSFGSELSDAQQMVTRKLLEAGCKECSMQLVVQPERKRQFEHYEALLTQHVLTHCPPLDPSNTLLVFGDDDDVWHPERIAAYRRAAQGMRVQHDAYQCVCMRTGSDDAPLDRTIQAGELCEYPNYAVRLDCATRGMQWLTQEAKRHRYADVAWSAFLASHPDLKTCAFVPPSLTESALATKRKRHQGRGRGRGRGPKSAKLVKQKQKPVLEIFGEEDKHDAAATNTAATHNWMYWVRDHAQYPRARFDISSTLEATSATQQGVGESKGHSSTSSSKNPDKTITSSATAAATSAAPVDFLATLPIFVITMPSQTERLERLKARLAHHGLYFDNDKAKAVPLAKDNKTKQQQQVHVVSALTPESDHVQLMFQGWADAHNPTINTRPQAHYYSQCKAIKQWLRTSTSEWAMILEDDAVPHDDFRKLLNGLWSQVPSSINMVLLTHFVSKWDGIEHVTADLCTMTPHVWMSIGYLVRRSWAEANIGRLDVPIVELAKQGMPCMWERILQSHGPTLFTRSCLLIEESVTSTIQMDAQLIQHLRYFTPIRSQFKRYECKLVLDKWADFEARQMAGMVSDLECFLATSLLESQSQDQWVRCFSHRSGVTKLVNVDTVKMWTDLAVQAYVEHASKSPFWQARFFAKSGSDDAKRSEEKECTVGSAQGERPDNEATTDNQQDPSTAQAPAPTPDVEMQAVDAERFGAVARQELPVPTEMEQVVGTSLVDKTACSELILVKLSLALFLFVCCWVVVGC